MEAAGRPSTSSSSLGNDTTLARNESTKRKKSLPNLFVLTRQRSQRSLRSAKASPVTAGVDRSFNSDLTSTNSPNVPPLPSPSQAAAQLKNADVKRRILDEKKDAERSSKLSVRTDGSQSARISSEASPRSFNSPQRRLPNNKNNVTLIAPPGVSSARPSYESQHRQPLSAAAPKPEHLVRPSQGELDNFDFRLPKRPHTATVSGAQLSPRHESYPLPQNSARPRQVSDANSSWAKSPKMEDFTPPWTNALREQNRGSSNSGFSTASSTLDTKRSSIFTKTSTTSEQTVDMDEVDDDYKDDIIDMYTSKPRDRLQPPRSSPEDRGNARDKRRSMAIAQATELSIEAASRRESSQLGTVPPSPMTPTTPATPAGEEGVIRLDNHRQHRPPPLEEKDPGFDQYGFRKTSREIDSGTYEAWHAEYVRIQNRRTDRWKELMLNNGLPYENPRCFPEPSGKVRRFIQKGIPAEWRGNAWFFYAGGHEYLDKYPGRYRSLLVEAQNGKLSQLDKESIERDLHRTFPDNVHFKPDQSTANTSPDPNLIGKDQSPILAALRRVLSAFAVDHPKIGYCQSLNFLAGMLLLFLPEERAFWMLHIITTDILPGTHETSLEGANVDLWVLMLAIRDTLPVVWQKLGSMPSETGNSNEMWQPDSIRLPPISLCTTSWFMSLYIGVLPTETVLRVWDLIFYDGSRVLFRVALAIFKLGEGDIKAIQDSMEIFQVVQSLPRRMIRCGVLMEQASNSKGKYAVTNTWVDKQRGTRKDFFARERGVEIARKMSKAGQKKADRDSRKSRESTSTAGEVSQEPPALGEISNLERRPTRKKSAWSVKRSGTVRKVTSPLA